MRPSPQPAPALAAWGNAWLAGHVSLDDAADAVERSGPQLVGEVPLRRWLAELRPAGLSAFRLALPAAGDPLGLTGPAELNTSAIEAGQAVLASVEDSVIGLVPAADLRGSSYVGFAWQVFEGRPGLADVPSLAEADHGLVLAMREVTEVLAELDDVNGRRTEALRALRANADGTLPPGYPPRAHRVDALAVRLTSVLALAEELAGHNLTATQMQRRAEALRLLDRAVRRARVAACNAVLEPAR
ncbi:hypothetical protein GCM10027589_44870 [Actinocorallia lasiicapitis]